MWVRIEVAFVLKNLFTLEWYVPVKWGFVLMFESKYGAIAGLEDDFYINPNERFFMGGSGLGFSESLRGYDDGDVGPVDENGRSLGGNYMTRFTTELRFPIAPNPTIFGLFFAEAGNVWQELDQTDLTGLRRSAGVGLRLFMPLLGIIGFDLGYGFD